MNGLSAIKKNSASTELEKNAGEGSLENNIKQLITDEAYSQISSKFPRLIPLIAGINIVEMIDDSTAIGAAVLGVAGRKLLVPVVYTNGDVDATTFIYSEDDDTILALTKKVVNVVIESSASLEGEAVGTGKTNYDIGDVHKLFVPPKTFSPKIASGGILFSVLEQSDLLKTALAEKLKNNEYRDVFAENYGEEAVKFIEESSLEKNASSVDETAPEALFSRSDIMNSDWLEKKAAMEEFAINGFAISQGVDYPKYSLTKIASVASRLKDITGDEALTTIDPNRQGVYTVFKKTDLKPIELMVSKNICSEKSSRPVIVHGPRIDIFDTIQGNGVIGKQKNISESDSFKDFSASNMDKDRNISIVFLDGGEIYGHVSIYTTNGTVQNGIGTTVISLDSYSRVSSVVIENDSSARPKIMGNTLYIGDKNSKILKSEDTEKRVSVVNAGDLSAEDTPKRLVKVAYDGVEYIYKKAAFSKPSLVNELLEEGFDKISIYGLLKTAEENGSAIMAAVNAKIDMLANMVMNLSGKIENITAQSGQEVQAQAQGNGLGSAQVQEGQQPIEQQQDAQQPAQLAMPDDASGIQTPEQQQATEQGVAEQQAADQQMLQQAPQEQQDTSGMNQAIDPEVLRTLSELKNSNVMDVGVISMIAANTEIGSVVAQYGKDIHAGASAIGRILLNALVKKNQIIEQVGEPKYKQLTNSLRTVFVKISDLYVDITRLQLESDGKVAD